jgi:two-component system sensor histidine kinase MprB
VSRLSLRVRFALLAAGLVLAVGALLGTAAYLRMRDSLYGQAERQARDQARQLAGLVDVPGATRAASEQGNRVDLADPSLSHDFGLAGLLVEVDRADGRVVQSSVGGRRLALPAAQRARCLRAGAAATHAGALALACRRVGPAAAPLGAIVTAARLDGANRSLSQLRGVIEIGLAAGVLVAALLALALAHHALGPARRIAAAARSIRAGDLGRRIDHRGPPDELGRLAAELDACFEELEAAVARQRDFVADASHELRTPLAALRAHVELLQGWAASSPPAREAALRALDQTARRASRLVADLLYLADVERQPPMERAPVSLDDVLLDVVRECQPLRPEVAIRVHELDDAEVMGDRGRLHQLLVNLVDNALRLSPAGSEVRLALTAAGGRATVTVTDAGAGIAEADLPHLFERFYRADRRSGGAERGPGLGLAIASRIAADHGGRLSAANDPEGGAVFRLELVLSSKLHPGHRDLSSRAPTLAGHDSHQARS